MMATGNHSINFIILTDCSIAEKNADAILNTLVKSWARVNMILICCFTSLQGLSVVKNTNESNENLFTLVWGRRDRNQWSNRPRPFNWVSRSTSLKATISTKWPLKVRFAFILNNFVLKKIHFDWVIIVCFYLLLSFVGVAGYVSFVRSYAALPKDVRDIFNFQSLHLGHYAKSFGLRDPPAQINTAGRAVQWNERKQFNTARERNPALKRAALGYVTSTFQSR